METVSDAETYLDSEYEQARDRTSSDWSDRLDSTDTQLLQLIFFYGELSFREELLIYSGNINFSFSSLNIKSFHNSTIVGSPYS